MPVELTASRTYPAGVARTFDTALSLPLPYLFAHRYAAIPPVTQVRDQGAWTTVGETRTIVLGDGGTILETLTEVERPDTFAYRLTDITGPMKLLATSVDGRFRFERAGTGVRVTWSWSVHPRGRLGRAAMPVFARMWRPYARIALERLEDVLVG
ncbi:SRPBCC family protein [Nocardioides aquiterrae]|uniref:SRPBCC family protein n=1 Tax=Nocardioides aquiterrae TaxID=203799 RepID=A0ABN1UCK9_9ACTN